MDRHFFKVISDFTKQIKPSQYGTYDSLLISKIKPLLDMVKNNENNLTIRSTIEEAINFSIYLGYPNRENVAKLKASKNRLYATMSVYGGDAYVENEELLTYDLMRTILSNYVRYSIKDFFGLTLDEFSNKTIYDQNILISSSQEIKEQKLKEDEELELLRKELDDEGE